MDVRAFADELLRALADTGLFERVALQAEGPIASGRAHVSEELFVRFHFNAVTGTIAFALIEEQRRIWGIDYDNRRGWHLHPADDPAEHVQIAPLSVSDIVARLQSVFLERKLSSGADADVV
ncbi:MAG: hypothetical protein SXV54_27805 [Chloroflexota bacterium]|nr:hypothetical protein [Chloroflexota bacterium]